MCHILSQFTSFIAHCFYRIQHIQKWTSYDIYKVVRRDIATDNQLTSKLQDVRIGIIKSAVDAKMRSIPASLSFIRARVLAAPMAQRPRASASRTCQAASCTAPSREHPASRKGRRCKLLAALGLGGRWLGGERAQKQPRVRGASAGRDLPLELGAKL